MGLACGHSPHWQASFSRPIPPKRAFPRMRSSCTGRADRGIGIAHGQSMPGSRDASVMQRVASPPTIREISMSHSGPACTPEKRAAARAASAGRATSRPQATRLGCLVLLLVLPGISLAEPSEKLARQKGCFACHERTVQKVGPSFTDIAGKYSQNDRAELATRMRKGTRGVWGPIPMPPQALSDREAQDLVGWILSLGTDAAPGQPGKGR